VALEVTSTYGALQIDFFTLHYIKRDHPVHTTCAKCPPFAERTLAFSYTFPKQLGIFSPNFARLLHVSIYARLQMFIQLFPTVTKLCHIKCDHPACVSADGGHFEHNGGRTQYGITSSKLQIIEQKFVLQRR